MFLKDKPGDPLRAHLRLTLLTTEDCPTFLTWSQQRLLRDSYVTTLNCHCNENNIAGLDEILVKIISTK